jgi:hypothetical protein
LPRAKRTRPNAARGTVIAIYISLFLCYYLHMLVLTQRGEKIVTAATSVLTVGLGYLALRHGGPDVLTHIGNAFHDIGATDISLPQATQDGALQGVSANTTEALRGAGLDLLALTAAGLHLARTSN